MKRIHYRNGDPITLPGGCDGCQPARINGVLCHETGCPEAWRDYAKECCECGCDYYAEYGDECRPCWEDRHRIESEVLDEHFHNDIEAF